MEQQSHSSYKPELFQELVLRWVKLIDPQKNDFKFSSYQSIICFISEKLYEVVDHEEWNARPGLETVSPDQGSILFEVDVDMFLSGRKLIDEDEILEVEFDFKSNNVVSISLFLNGEYGNEVRDRVADAITEIFESEKIEKDVTWEEALILLKKLDTLRRGEFFFEKMFFSLPQPPVLE